MTTYDDVLCAMKNAFFEKSGQNVEKYSELSLRFEAVASEIYSLVCASDFVLKQAFPQTAGGKYLDFHARLRGITRKTASAAKVMLTFSLDSAKQSDTVIKKGCICSSAKNPYIQFVTCEDAVVPAGELEISVPATASQSGNGSNVKEGEITVIVNPPLTVARVKNSAPFEIGIDAENDEMLRRRILNSYSVPQSGFSCESMREAILSIDEVIDCRVAKNGSELDVSLKTKDSTLSDELKNAVMKKLYFADFAGVNVKITLAVKKNFSIFADAKCSVGEYERIESEIKNAIKDKIGVMPIGESLNLDMAVFYAMSVDGVEYCELSSPQSEQGAVICSFDEYLNLDKIEVNCRER